MSKSTPPSDLVGRVVATEKRPNTAEVFYFWTNTADSPVGIGTIVTVVHEDTPGNMRTVYGVVVEGESYTDVSSPLHDYLGSEGDPGNAAPTLRPEIRCYKAAVLRTIPEEPLQPVPMGLVYLADDHTLQEALQMETYVATSGIPIGLYQSGGLSSPVYLDENFLLGPEAAHINISGVSGLATKTSALEFLMASIFAHSEKSLPAKKRKGVAVVCFNVKGSDLLYLDQPAPLDEADLAMYDRLNIPAQPFAGVSYFAPYKADGINLNTLRNHSDLIGNVYPLRWGISEVIDYVHVMLNREDIDAKADALIDFIKERIINAVPRPEYMLSQKVTDFAGLVKWFNDVLEEMEASNQSQWKTHAVQTIRKIYNRLSNLPNRCGGLIVNNSAVTDLPWGEFHDRHIYVIDVANMEELAQDLVFTRVVDQLRRQLEHNTLGVGRVIVFVDELNKYAAADGSDTYLKRTLLDISERGRYLGLVLFSAQQFRSQVHKRVVGNSATAIYGRMDSDELATPGYGTFSPAIKTKLATLSKGQLLVRHPHFAHPIFVKFPHPAVLRGQDGREMFPPEADLPFEEAMVKNFRRRWPKLTSRQIKDALANIDPAEVQRAFSQLEQHIPADKEPLPYFNSIVRRRPPTQPLSRQREVMEDFEPF